MAKPLNLLIVEDVEDDALLLTRHLRKGGYDVNYERVEDAESMRAALKGKTWDVILCDYKLPRFSVAKALKIQKKSGLDLPFIIVSGTVGEERAADLMRAGADDLILKDSLARLVPAIKRELTEAKQRRKYRRTKAKLADWDKRFRLILDNAVDGIISIDERGIIESFNPAAETIFGYSAEEVLGKNVKMLMPQPYHDEHDGYLANYLRTGEAKIIGIGQEVKGLRKDGTIFPMDLGVSQLPFGGKSVFVGFVRDITDRKRAEEALRESEALFRTVVDYSPTNIHIKDVEGRYTLINKEAEKLFGVTDEEGRGKTSHDLFPKEIADTFIAHDRAVIESGEVGEEEEEFTLEDGVHTYLTAKFPIYDQGRVVAVGAIRTDITDRKRAVEKIRESEAQLFQAQKMETVGNLTGGIAHDFNNILGFILGNLQLFKRRLKDEDRFQSLIEAAIDATHRGADLTKRLLAFSRRQELDPRVLDVNALVAGMDKILRRTLGEQIEIETVFADGLGHVKADPAQLESALLNLALNARDAMPGGGRLMIETTNTELDNGYAATRPYAKVGPHVCISVCDTGTGIPEEIRDRIFEPFFTTKEVGRGSGLGLSMIYGFVKQSGGHINVYSEDGRGTRFRIYLPRIDEPSVAIKGREAGTDDLPRGTETVLLVEDDEQFRRTAALLLEDLGYTVIGEPDGPSALKSLEVYPDVDILFTDMVMPGGMNGHELAQRARELQPGLPVLLASGYPRNAFSEGRRFPLLSKPYTDVDLARMVRAVLDGRQEPEK